MTRTLPAVPSRRNMASHSMVLTRGRPSASGNPVTSTCENALIVAYGSTAARALVPGVGTAIPAFASSFVHAVLAVSGTRTVYFLPSRRAAK